MVTLGLVGLVIIMVTLATKSYHISQVNCETPHREENLTPSPDAADASPGAIPKQVNETDQTTIEQMDEERHQYIYDTIAYQGIAERIDTYLATRKPYSPLNGYGWEFAMAQRRTGVSAYLLVGLTYRETSLGTNGYTCAGYNYWCMKANGWTRSRGIGERSGWCAWPDIPTAIQQAADFIAHFWGPAQTAHDTRGYCEGHPSEWVRAVEGCRTAIEGIEI